MSVKWFSAFEWSHNLQPRLQTLVNFTKFELFQNVLLRIRNYNSVGIYLLKVSNKNTRTKREVCSKLTIKTPE